MPDPASSPKTSQAAETAQTKLERAELQYAQAKARLLSLKNRAATQARKLDTRRKIVLGGALVDLASRDDAAAAMLDRLVRNLPREQDRRAFEGWDLRQAATTSSDPGPSSRLSSQPSPGAAPGRKV